MFTDAESSFIYCGSYIDGALGLPTPQMVFQMLALTSTMASVALAVWLLDPLEPLPCAALVVAFAWCSHRAAAAYQ